MTRTERLLAVTATLAVAATGGVLSHDPPLWLRRALSRQPELVDLVASKPPRTIDGRLTGGFDWAPKVAAARSGAADISASPNVRIAVARAEMRVAKSRSADTLQTLAAGLLLSGDIDGAARALTEALADQPRSPSLQSDFSAALLARGTDPERALDLPRALDAAEQAVALQGGPEAYFNRALALERLHLRPEAMAAWKKYLQVDSASPWAAEVTERLSRLRQAPGPSTADDGQVLRDRLFDDLLGAWATAALAGRWDAARESVGAATALGRDIASHSDDRLAADVLAEVSRATANRGRLTATLAAGHDAFARARVLYLHDDFDASREPFVSAERELRRAGSPLAEWAQVHLAILSYRHSEFAHATELFTRAQRVGHERTYHGIAGKADWGLGLLSALQGNSLQAAFFYRRAAGQLAAAREPQNQATIAGLLATNFDELGDPAKSWIARLEALSGTAREGVLLRASFEAMRSDLPHAALIFAAAAGAQAERSHRPATRADALRWQAVIAARLHEPARARALLQQARTVIGTQTGVTWDRLRAETDVAAAMSADPSALTEALAAASRALGYFESSSTLDRLPEIYLARARLHRATGSLDASRPDLERGLDVVQRLREHVATGPDQATLTDVTSGLVEELVDLSVATSQEHTAWNVVERTRGRDLPLSVRAPVDLATIQSALPPGTTLIEFAVGERHTFVWLLRHDERHFAQLQVGRAALSALVESHERSSFDPVRGAALRRAILAPVDRFIGARDLLVIVADGPLFSLPFAALPGRQSRFLASEHPVAYAVSATAWAGGRQAAARATGAPGSIVAAGATAVDRARYPNLAPLPHAAAEARAIAALYPRGIAMVGDEVTREAMVRAVASSDVLHFAGHAVVYPLSPSRSELVIAGADGRGWTALDVRGLRNVRARLVVLAACESAGGFMTRSEGPLGLARAFLAAGVPTVVASRWKLDDYASREFFAAFHTAYRRSGRASEAVQTAQLAMLNAADVRLHDPAVWAGISVFETHD